MQGLPHGPKLVLSSIARALAYCIDKGKYTECVWKYKIPKRTKREALLRIVRRNTKRETCAEIISLQRHGRRTVNNKSRMLMEAIFICFSLLTNSIEQNTSLESNNHWVKKFLRFLLKGKVHYRQHKSPYLDLFSCSHESIIGLLPCSHEPTSWLYSVPDAFNQHHNILVLLQDPFY